MLKALTRPMSVVLRFDRHAVLNIESVIQSLGYDPRTVQEHELPLGNASGWRVWRVYPTSAVVDQIPALTPAEIAALNVQPGILGVWMTR